MAAINAAAIAGGTPFTKDVTLRWSVRNAFTKDVTLLWTVRNAFFKDVSLVWSVRNFFIKDHVLRWSVRNAFTKDVTLVWNVANAWFKDVVLRWQVVAPWVKDVVLRWSVQNEVPLPEGNAAVLTAQRQATIDFINYDPTPVQLIPNARTTTPSGGFSEASGTPRSAQVVKLILLAYDERPSVTLAGVERIIDYHLLGRWDMEIETGDYWIDSEGTRWDVVGFSEGWDYETKAFVSRHVPREARP
jgi:hypothetical protein